MTRWLLLIGPVLALAVPVVAPAQEPASPVTDDHVFQIGVGIDLAYRLYINGQMAHNRTDRVLLAIEVEGGQSVRSMGTLVGLSESDFSSVSSLAALRLGAGAGFGRATARHTLLVLTGPQYSHIRESHAYPDLEPASVSASAWLVDFGVQYGLRLGSERTFLSSRIYLPLRLIPDNLMGLSVNLGVGFRMP